MTAAVGHARVGEGRLSLSGAFAAGRLRIDLWNRLAGLATEGSLTPRTDPRRETIRAQVAEVLEELAPYERYWAHPGPDRFGAVRDLLERGELEELASVITQIANSVGELGDQGLNLDGRSDSGMPSPHYFSVLLVDDSDPQLIERAVEGIRQAGVGDDDFVYEVVHVDNAVDGVAAVFLNRDIQACIVRADVRPSPETSGPFDDYVDEEMINDLLSHERRGVLFGEVVRELRPELDLYLLAGESAIVEKSEDHDDFDRVFYELDDPIELHLTLLEGVRKRYETPFFDALTNYARKPVGNFHALPIARGHSVFNSRWIKDMGRFYGRNIFLAETSSTSGGLDSLLAPKGPIAEAQQKAAEAFGSRRTFFSTNGTSTSNKIVVQALTGPGDIVLIDRNCHISHHYGLVLGGGHPLYLDAYPLAEYVVFGAVPLRTIKRRLLELREAGRLDDVKMLLLTNCTFDGIVYDPIRVMSEVLAIKSDMVFLWDEAWFAYASSSPLMRTRTAMYAARHLEEMLASDDYPQRYSHWKKQTEHLDWDDESVWLDNQLLPDPQLTQIRVYATQSTHKSLSALRQGSMMHVYDQRFERDVAHDFIEALQTHTSTSPNYQVIASLNLARRQAQLEGYGMVSETYEMAMTLRARVAADPVLNRYFRVLEPADLIPAEFRQSGVTDYSVDLQGREDAALIDASSSDEFMLDPTRNTLYVAGTGFNGNEFKVDVLMDRYGIQVNKTSINSVLLIMSIGVTWSGMAYVLDSLREIARELDRRKEEESDLDSDARAARIRKITEELPPMPSFSAFHPAFRPHPATGEGDMRAAFYLSRRSGATRYVPLAEAIDLTDKGEELVSTTMVVPYPPGFPVLVPGQVVSSEILSFLNKLDVKEIHGYNAAAGLSVFTEEALSSQLTDAPLVSK